MKLVLRQERENKRMTQEEVSKQIGVTRAAYTYIENGKRKPSYEVLVKLLDLFGYDDPRELFAEAPEQPISSKE